MTSWETEVIIGQDAELPEGLVVVRCRTGERVRYVPERTCDSERDYWRKQFMMCLTHAINQKEGRVLDKLMSWPRPDDVIEPYQLVTNEIDSLRDYYADLSVKLGSGASSSEAENPQIWQAIANELNAALSGGECECVWNEQEGTFHCSSCDTLLTSEISIEWPSHKVTPITLPNYCPNCGAKVVD